MAKSANNEGVISPSMAPGMPKTEFNVIVTQCFNQGDLNEET